MSDKGSPCTHLSTSGTPAGFLGELLQLCPLRALLGHVERLPLLAERLRANLTVLKKKEKHTSISYPLYLYLGFSPVKYQIPSYREIVANEQLTNQ